METKSLLKESHFPVKKGVKSITVPSAGFCMAVEGHSDNSYQATTRINLKKRQLISGDISYQFEKATTHIK